MERRTGIIITIIDNNVVVQRELLAEFQTSSETQGFKGEGDGKETGSEKNEEKERGGAGKGKEEGEALGIFSTKSFSRPFAFLSCYWPHF